MAQAFALAEPRLDAVTSIEARYHLAQCFAAQGKFEPALAALRARGRENPALSPDLRRRIEALVARLHVDASGAEAAGAPGRTLFELLLQTRARLTAAAGPWGVPGPGP
ncbi:MAG TPA: hypothetical protein VF121_07160 [Thermoanaerobaculia bacterium]|nr:hypothetical protein [Thermoanaerobaculia bacterium]